MAAPVILGSDVLHVRIDPSHGGEVIDLVDLRSGRQLLGRPPFASAPPQGGDLDEASWTRSYRGGWQLLTPNAGAACTVAGRHHGFHGRASNDPWEVVAQDPSSVDLRWTGHGLAVERRFTVAGATLHADVCCTAARRTPLVAVEHLALGIEVLDPEVEITLPAGRAAEMDEHEAGPDPFHDGARWPEIALADGSIENGQRWPLSLGRSRLMCVQDVPAGWARVANARSGAGVELAWDVESLPHIWLWHEVRRSGGPWRGLTELLVVEPASVPHHLGLARAIAEGQASWAGPGRPFAYRISVTALSGDG
jgi:hypothetical protein